jgi:osmoprotectant transport system permease protein
MSSGFTFIVERLPELWMRTGEHIMLTGISTGIAIAVGVPLGILAERVRWLRGPLLGAIGILQTVPSLAMLAILLAVIQRIGAVPAIIALVLYALLPIARNTLAGLQGVPEEVLEAARGIGMTERQKLWMVQMPLALPVIVAGVRTAAVVGVGIATLSAFIGAGGLGQFINRGLALSNTPLIMLGAVPAALLALVVDFSIVSTEWGLRPARQGDRGTFRQKLKPLALALPLLIVTAGFVAYLASSGVAVSGGTPESSGIVRVGSKNFTEQLILGELLAQLIEDHTDLTVDRRFNMGGTMICHGALTSGEIDLYAEYTGTGLTAVLKQDVIADPDEALEAVRRGYRAQFGAHWLAPFGFNNTYAITVRKAAADRHGWKKLSDLVAPSGGLRAGFTSEFAERPDGYPGLRDAYRLSFAEVRDLDPAIMYQAIANDEVDVICAFATDGRIAAYDLQPLEDDLGFFPPYYAAPVVLQKTLETYPELREILQKLAGALDDATMQQLNYEVDENQLAPAEVVRSFIASRDGLRD